MPPTTSALSAFVFVVVYFLPPEALGQRRDLCTATPGGRAGQCRPLIKCVRFAHEIPLLRQRPCRLLDGENGVCCPHIVLGTATFSRAGRFGRVFRRPRPLQVPLPQIRFSDLQTASAGAERRQADRRRVENRLRNAGLSSSGSGGRRRVTPVSKHRRLQRTNPRARQLGRKATRLVDASAELAKTFRLSPAQGTHALPIFSLVGTSLGDIDGDDDLCSNEIGQTGSGRPEVADRKCSSANQRFRSLDGSCNNLKHSHWGQANTALQRILAPDYEDGISVPRGSSGSGSGSGSGLASARELSETLIPDQDNPSRDHTLLLMQWGQFLDHDLTHTPMVQGHDDSDVTCCSNGREIPLQSGLRHPECFPIAISANDAFYARFGQTCMEFVRSMPARNEECKLGPREQVNQITAFIDGSNVYGSDLSEARLLRLGRRGRLRVTKFNGQDLLPLQPEECADHAKRQYCFAAGDSRCNEQPQLTAVHTLWLREHNRVASQLALLNSHWDDERLYQEARRIVGAQLQHITHNEWLPIILGTKYMDSNGLSIAKTGFTKNYKDDVNPSITNAFATAAFRFGHSLVQGQMDWVGQFGTRLKSLLLHQHQLSPFEIYEQNSLDGLVRGLATQPAQKMDWSFSRELTRHLFQETNSTSSSSSLSSNAAEPGMDLMALNLQRGRDHGLPTYAKYRQLCGLSPIASWRQLNSVISSPELVPRLQRLYRSVDDIDLFLGGILERPLAASEVNGGGLLGPTFQCIIGDQFKRLKWGDRFWFEEIDQPNSFTNAQVDALRESNLARILCDNGDDIRLMQPLAFKKAEGMNEKASCNGKAIPSVNLAVWREGA